MVPVYGVGPDPVDPLLDCTFTTLTPSLNQNPNLNLHSHLQAMVLRSPGKLLKQVHTILDESMQQDKASFPESDNMIKNVFSKNDNNPREKRPALGLKRAKFSMKPMPSQPDVVPEPTIDISKLSDPVEFFAAYERMENAKKELRRLRGEPVTDLDENLPITRQRRPSLFGKSATYKHRYYSSALPDNSEKFLSSQEKSEKHIQSPIREAPAENDVMNNYEHARLSDSIPAVTSESNELDELLSCDYEGLDEAGIVDLVQKKLQIKLIDIGLPTFPDLLDVPRRESETSCDSLSKMKETISRLNGVRNAAGSKRLPLSSQFMGASVHHQGQSRSPLASISLLNRRISKLSTLTDPFSALDGTGSLPVRTTPSPETLQPNQFDARDDLYESQPLEHVRETAEVANPSTLSEERITKSVERQEQPDGFGQCSQDGAREDLQEHVDSMVHGEETTAVASVTDVSSPETLQPNQFDARDDLYESQPLEHVREIAEVANPSTLSEERITTQSVEHQEQPDGFGQYSQDGAREDLHEHMDSMVHGEETTAVASVTHVGDAPPITGQDGSESGQDGAVTDLGALRRSPGEHSVADVGDAPRISAAVGIDLTSENNEQRDETIQADPLRDAIQHEPNIELSAAEKSCSKEGEECGIDKTLTTEDIVAEEPNKEAAEHSKRKLEKGKRKLVKGKKSKVSSPGNASKGTAETGGEANPQPDVPDSVSEMTGNRKRKAEGTQRMNKREQLRCRRNSLYEAGTKWEAGVRRSTRIRMRPLEFWKGERFLYGRVHNSLVTVIGVKYSSPSTQDDAPPDKVKAFVSDEYKELVDLAAYY